MKLNLALGIAVFACLNPLGFCKVTYNGISSSTTSEIAKGINEFGVKLLRHGKEKKNFLVSPIGIVLGLGMVYVGAEEDSAQQIVNALNWGSLERPHIYQGLKTLQEPLHSESKRGTLQLKFANYIWADNYSLPKDSFIDNVKYIYNSSFNLSNFEKDPDKARLKINQRVSEQTSGKINEFFPAGFLTRDTNLVLVNAVYFKGLWEHQFDQRKTFLSPFYAHGKIKNKQVVEMMSMNKKLKYFHDDKNACQVLRLPYAGKEASMLFILPKRLNGLKKLEEALTMEDITKWTTNLTQTTLTVSLPKFNLSHELDMKDVLPNLGIIDIFDERKAHLSGLSERKDLFVSSAMHRAYIDVNEKGTEAAAATGVVARTIRTVNMNESFNANHPFLFLAYHEPSQSILFLGRVVEIN